MALAIAIFVAAFGPSLFHFYQGLRAMAIIAQLSILFGVLFVFSGFNLWAVMLSHGIYDTLNSVLSIVACKSKNVSVVKDKVGAMQEEVLR